MTPFLEQLVNTLADALGVESPSNKAAAVRALRLCFPATRLPAQVSTAEQLRVLERLGNILGLYDAADVLARMNTACANHGGGLSAEPGIACPTCRVDAQE